MRLYRTSLLMGAAAIAAIGFAGCGQKDDTPPSTTVVTTAPPPSAPSTTTVVPTTTPPGPTATVPPTNNTNAGAGGATGLNASLADAVNKKIRTNTQMTGSRITAVAESDGTIRLTGTAQNAQQKALAESAAHDTTGVNHVINKVEIVATGGAKTTAAPATKTITKTKVIVVKGPPSGSTSTGGSTSPSGNGSTDTTGTAGAGSTDGTSTTGSTNPTPPSPPSGSTGP